MLAQLLIVFFAVPEVAAQSWLGDWANRVSFTISSSDVDSDLTFFPVLVHISDSCGKNTEDLSFVFDEIGASYLKTAWTKSDGTTQIYAAVEDWDSVGEEGFAHVSKNDWVISSSSDTVFYLYYDSAQDNNTAYVGSQTSAVAQNVWDGNYELSLQLSNDNLEDATNHNNDGTNDGSVDLSPSVIAAARSFDDDDNIYYSSTGILDDFTIDFWVKLNADTGGDGGGIMGRFDGGTSSRHNTASVDWGFLHTGTSGVWRMRFTVGGSNYALDSSTNPVIGSWIHITVIRDGVNGYLYLGSSLDSSTSGIGGGDIDSEFIFHLGQDYSGTFYDPDCSIDQVTISSTIRGSAWIVVTDLSGFDDLLDPGTEEELPTSTFFITFQNNSTGAFYVNCTEKTNGTSTEYNNETALLLMGLPASNYTFLSFNWTGSSNTSNPSVFIVSENQTIWLYFGTGGGGGAADEDYTDPGDVAAILVATLILLPLSIIFIWKLRRR